MSVLVVTVLLIRVKYTFAFTKTKHYLGDQIKKYEMCGACGLYGRNEKCIQGFSAGNLKERDHLKGLGIDGRIILKWVLKK
jgi:hypothetical protein